MRNGQSTRRAKSPGKSDEPGRPGEPRKKRGTLTRLTLALLAATGLALSTPSPAQATTTVDIPAPTPDGVSATVRFSDTVVPKPYTPDPTAYFGDRKCLNTYHDYDPTPGCGGFKLAVTLHNVRNQPGYLAGLSSTDYWFKAYADTARTFGCLRPDGTFDHSTAFVVRTTQQELLRTYYYAEANWVLHELRQSPTRDAGPHFYMNFPAVPVDCPTGTTPTQYGLKVSNIRVTITDDNVFGHSTWNAPGPFYG
ncbi:hypothetical protein [Streptomyces lincolnensis]|uniref:hypothetical protein n=1 Tax=Streptomyces lincolnensis TaxID=1915 RepID=UPI000834268B|nr:hypothetical protein [Streptomyces lincolnensis]QMV08228.1 hypothetical protein GJU35_22975 [Streptomyces lincolnensis]